MRTSSIVLIVIFIAMLVFSAQSQTVAGKRLESDINFLADDLLKGRGTPSEGLDVAALYLANQLHAYGWEPTGYYQSVELEYFSPQASQYHIAINNITLSADEFIFMPFGMNPSKTPVNYDLVFLGQGVFAPEKNVDDFMKIELQGKAGVALYGAPWEMDPNALHSCDRCVGKAVQVGVRKGALLVYVTEELAMPAGSKASAEIAVMREMAQVPLAFLPDIPGKTTWGATAFLIITPKAFDKALADVSGNTYGQWQKKISKKQREKSFDLKAAIDITIKTETVAGIAKNVIGTLKSNDPVLGNEWVVLTAHYDHIGFHEVPAGEDGIWNGADDNASGTAAILEVARKLSENGNLRRSVMVVFTCGEEMGLLGSFYFATHPPVPQTQIVLNIDADMVGRSAGTAYCINTGCDALLQKAQSIGEKVGIAVLPEPYPDWRLVYFIDCFNFARFNIPFIDFMTEFHADYHQPTDEVKLIKFGELEKITNIIYEMATYYANSAERPAFKRPAWFLTAE